MNYEKMKTSYLNKTMGCTSEIHKIRKVEKKDSVIALKLERQ